MRGTASASVTLILLSGLRWARSVTQRGPAAASPLSPLVQSLKASRTIEIHALTKTLEAQGKDVVSLCVGEPDFQPPQYVLDATAEAAHAGRTKYTGVAGDLRLRGAICRDLLRRKDTAYEPEQVLVSNGAKQAIYQAVLALCSPGDEVVMAAPFWPSYPEIVRLAGAKAVVVPTRAQDGFAFTAEQLRSALTPETKMVILCNPVNPTGTLMNEVALDALAEVLLEEDNEHVWILADEIYERIVYGRDPHVSFAALKSGALKERTLVINGFSKSHAMTGYRLGYLATDNMDVVQACTKLQSQLTSCASSIAQEAASAALADPARDDSYMKGCVEELRQKRDLVCDAVNGMPGIELDEVPEGAFYVFPDVSQLMQRRTPDGTIIETSHDLCLHLLQDYNVALVSGEGFGFTETIRISYATSVPVLEEAMRRIGSCFKALQ